MTPSDDPTAALPGSPPADDATSTRSPHPSGTGSEAPAAGPLPDRLGKYRVLGRLGQGGMGAVYRAEDPVLGRVVALKAMLPALAADPAARARFLREARAQAGVEHDHVVPIFDVVDDGPAPFIAMPLLKGSTLADALRLNPRPPLAEAVRIAREMAEGLAAAHAPGLIHRDIKPANVWLEAPRRRVKLLDFGLARGAGDADAPTSGTHTALSGVSVTATGAIMGTPLYMSPEQARGRKLDARTDLFSLGVVLYEMLTGERPFAAPNAAAVLRKVVAHQPDGLARLDPPAPPRLAALVSRLLAKAPAGRPGSAEEVAAELEAIAADLDPHVTVHLADGLAGPNPFADLDETEADAEPVATAARRRPPRARSAVLAAGVGALVVGVLLAAALFNRAKLGVLTIETDPPVLEVVVRKDGVVVAGPTDERRLSLPPGAYTVEPADPKVRAKVEPARVELGAGATGKVVVWEVKTPRPKPAATPAEATALDFGPLARNVPRTDGWMTVSPDGKLLVLPVSDGANQVWVLDARTGAVHQRLGGFAARAFRFAFSPNGKLLAGTSIDGSVRVWDTATWNLDRRVVLTGEALTVAFAPDGSRMAAAGAELRVWDTADWAERFVLPIRSAHAHGLAFSPDGKHLAVSAQETGEVRLIDPARGDVVRTFDPGGVVHGLAFSPDGKHLAGGFEQLHVWEAATGRLVRTSDGDANWVRFSADGKRLWAGPWSDKRRTGQAAGPLTLRRPTGEAPVALAHPPYREYMSFAVSPDEAVLYAAVGGEVWALDPATGRPLPRTVSAFAPDVAAAELLHPHATLTLRLPDGTEKQVNRGDALPAGPYRLVMIDHDGGANFTRDVFASRVLPAVEPLTELRVWWGWEGSTTEADVERLAAAACGKTLQAFGGTDTPLTARTVRALGRMPKLWAVHLDCGPADDEVLVELAKLPFRDMWFAGLGRSGKVTDRGLATLTGMPLTQLQLRDCPVLDAALCRRLAAMPGLKKLRVSQSGAGFGELAASKSLTELGLHDLPVTDDDLAPLAKLASLRSLHLTGSRVTFRGMEKLSAALPNCQITSPCGYIESRAHTISYPFIRLHSAKVQGTAFLPDGRIAWSDATGFFFDDPEPQRGRTRMDGVGAGKQNFVFAFGPYPFARLEGNLDVWVYFGGDDGSAGSIYIDPTSGKWSAGASLPGAHPGRIGGLAILPDRTGWVSASTAPGRELKVWDTQKNELVRAVDSPGLVGLALRPGATPELAGPGIDGTLVVWETKNWTRRSPAASPDLLDKALAYSPDGRLLATALRGGGVRVWDADKLTKLRDLPGHPGGTNAVAFAPGGKVLVAAGADKLVRLWDATTGDPLHTFEGHTDAVRCVAVSPDGRLVATGSDDRTARVWEVPPAARRLIPDPAAPAAKK